jgi:hypothetical protein
MGIRRFLSQEGRLWLQRLSPRDGRQEANVLIGSGDAPEFLSEAAKQTKADSLVTACYPYGGNLRIHGCAIICPVPIPVLSV